jgi:predicted membrane protein
VNTSPVHPLAPVPHHAVRDYGRILLGLVVVALGTLFLLESADVLDAGKAIGDWWPALIIATGLFQFAERSHGWFEPTVFVLAGTILLLVTTGVISGNVWDFVWPTAIIVAGLFIITRWHAVAGGRALRGEDTIVADGIFGGPTVASGSQSFRGGSLTAVFGGVTLDLRSALPAPEGAVISATAVFGGVEIIVPHGWRVAVKATPIFGGVDDKTVHEAALGPDAPTITIDGLVLFGGIEIRHDKKK